MKETHQICCNLFTASICPWLVRPTDKRHMYDVCISTIHRRCSHTHHSPFVVHPHIHISFNFFACVHVAVRNFRFAQTSIARFAHNLVQRWQFVVPMYLCVWVRANELLQLLVYAYNLQTYLSRERRFVRTYERSCIQSLRATVPKRIYYYYYCVYHFLLAVPKRKQKKCFETRTL